MAACRYETDGSITKESHPVFRPHLLQGWTPDFVPCMVEHAREMQLYDELGHVSCAWMGSMIAPGLAR